MRTFFAAAKCPPFVPCRRAVARDRLRLFHPNFDVLQCALRETSVLHFLERITLRNSPKFIESTRRAPTAAIDPVLQRGIERGAIHAGLAAGDYFQSDYAAFGL